MHIVVVGKEDHLEECHQKFGDQQVYSLAASPSDAKNLFDKGEVIFDFVIEKNPDQIKSYDGLTIPIFLNTSKITLARLHAGIQDFHFGFAGMPTFLSREVMEVSISNPAHKEKLSGICHALKTDFEIVADQVGLVTPRVIGMIINEAYYTVEEGTATREDIDLAMKLGTNYPFGPFEWCQKIGAGNVVELLHALHQETNNPRYKICQLLISDADASKL